MAIKIARIQSRKSEQAGGSLQSQATSRSLTTAIGRRACPKARQGGAAELGTKGFVRPTNSASASTKIPDSGPRPPPGPPPQALLQAAAVPIADWCKHIVDGNKRMMAPRISAASQPSVQNVILQSDDGQALGSTRAGVDNEGRPFDTTRVVVNFANVGATYGERVLKRSKGMGQTLFDYEGVRRCVTHLTQNLGMTVVGVVFENFKMLDTGGQEVWSVPKDIEDMCETVQLAPRVCGEHHRSADDEMTIKCAFRRNCRFLDNDNYADWKAILRDENAKSWLQSCQDFLQMRYYFDSGTGDFDTLDGNVEAGRLARGIHGGDCRPIKPRNGQFRPTT